MLDIKGFIFSRRSSVTNIDIKNANVLVANQKFIIIMLNFISSCKISFHYHHHFPPLPLPLRPLPRPRPLGFSRAGSQKLEEDVDNVAGQEGLLRVVPGRQVGEDGGHLVLDVDAGAEVVRQVLEEDAHRPLLRHRGQDQRGQEREVGEGGRAQEEGLVTLGAGAEGGQVLD